MKKIIFTSIAFLALNISQAAYIIKIPFEQSNGGGILPTGSINFISEKTPEPIENWQPAESIISNWANNGALYGCVGTPSESTYLQDDEFTQTFNNCKQDQTRTIQKREQETTTLAYRNIDNPITETKTNNIANYVTKSLGTASCLYTNPKTYWLSGVSTSQLAHVYGVTLPVKYGATITSIYYNGKFYKKGPTVMGVSNGNPLYAVCK